MRLLLIVAIACLAAGCGRESADAPPTVLLGESICAECGMIISDERFATATVIDGPRGPESRLFDDFNCQVNYEAAHPDVTILARWSHDYSSREWLRTEDAFFIRSPKLMAPMASETAAVSSQPSAEAVSEDVDGQILTFEQAWKRLH